MSRAYGSRSGGDPKGTVAQGRAPIGHRVAYWRNRRNLSQQVFADRLGKSKSWVDKVERGVRTLDKYSVLLEIAAALRIDIAQLIGPDPQMGGDGRLPDHLEPLRTALDHYDWVGPAAPSPMDPIDPASVEPVLRHAWSAYQRAAYDDLIGRLPQLLRTVQMLSRRDNDQAALLRCQAYQVTCALLATVEAHELARLAGDRALAAAKRLADPLLIARTSVHTAYALIGVSRPRAAVELCVGAARTLIARTPQARRVPVEHSSTVGALLATAMLAAARIGDARAVEHLRSAADRRAVDLGRETPLPWGTFGPATLAIDHMRAAVELGEAPIALALAHQADRAALDSLPIGRRAQRLITIAQAYLLTGDTAQAGNALLAADHTAPGQVRHQPVVHRLIDEIIRRDRSKAPATLATLAEHLVSYR